jgi:hypothetical protein
VLPDWRSHGDVYLSRLHAGVTDSDSVARLRYRLQNHPDMPGTHRPGYGQGYGPEVVEAVRHWQRHIAPHALRSQDDPTDGKSLSGAQADALFTRSYTVIGTQGNPRH